ncbi:hypothetical protein [Marivirga sp.]|uniref:hypothetical protein n=1 Tax=Marivirga sp. TaxID=2018662 RepID=UPI002D7F5844|nr:hypothetical protein [Marivirga sp.]HET8860895.1 hypothetical protein [Marivirga sp.]
MKKLSITFLLTLFALTYGIAQDYNTSIGLRGGFSNGITIKHFVSSKAAFEGIIASRWRGVELTGLYEIHGRAFDTERLNWYAGFGAHVGFWDGRDTRWGEDRSYTVVGIDGILGLEYNFVEIPFNISVDWKPAFNLYGYTGFWADGGALSIRYIF